MVIEDYCKLSEVLFVYEKAFVSIKSLELSTFERIVKSCMDLEFLPRKDIYSIEINEYK